MALTIEDVNEYLKQVDEVSLLEVLGINSEDIVERFQDYIEERFDTFAEDLESDYESN